MGADIVVVLEREKIVITLLVQSLQNDNSSPPQITLKCRDIGVTCHLRQKRVISGHFLVGFSWASNKLGEGSGSLGTMCSVASLSDSTLALTHAQNLPC